MIIDDSQKQAARVVGIAYLAALPPAVFAEFFVRNRLVDPGNAAQTALNIVAHERLFRLGIAANLVTFALDVALIAALYLVLRPVSRLAALTALGWGLIETAVLVTVAMADFDVLRLLSGAAYLHPLATGQLQALARVHVGAHGAAYNVGLFLAGLRSTAFCMLWLRSGYVPKALAILGVVASFLMGACAFVFIVFPELANLISVGVYGGPIFVFELTMGSWLVARGIRQGSR
jgi:uncharacterized protein DUF4386